MNKITFIIYIAFIMGLYSCQDVIVLDNLDTGEPQLVIEGVVTDQAGPYQVSITKSISFYDRNIFPGVSGAEVTISDDNGYVESLAEISDGIYQTSQLQGQRGRTYTLEVKVEGKTFIASSTIPSTIVPIDSLVFEFEEESIFLDEGYFPYAYFTDPINESNYYNLNIYVNGEPYDYNRNDTEASPDIDDNYWLIDDKFFDGRIQDFFFFTSLNLGDNVEVELHQVDKSTYDYYRTLLDITDGTGVAPANPISNFGDGALGYFAAYGVSTVEGVVE